RARAHRPSSAPPTYTTLFRSRGAAVEALAEEAPRGRHRQRGADAPVAQPPVIGDEQCRAAAEREAGHAETLPIDAAGQPLTAAADRKSTRLNSSHQIISYAVF